MNTAAALFAKTNDAAIITSLLALNAVEAPTEEQRLVTTWACAELESRYPDAVAVLEYRLDCGEFDGTALSYPEILLAALPVAVFA